MHYNEELLLENGKKIYNMSIFIIFVVKKIKKEHLDFLFSFNVSKSAVQTT